MIILLIIFFVLEVLGVFLIIRDELLGNILLPIASFCCVVLGITVIQFSLKTITLREQIKNVQYLTALDVAKINKEIAHIKAHPFMYLMLDTEGLEYISLDNAEAIPLKDVTK